MISDFLIFVLHSIFNPCDDRRSCCSVMPGGALLFRVSIAVLLFYQARSAYASLAFCKRPDLNTPGRPARLCGKKYLARGAGREDFFPANPQGLVLSGLSRCSEICLRKSQWGKIEKVESA